MFMFYSDICEPYVTGDVQSRLLRTVSLNMVDYTYNGIKLISFSPPMYIPLLFNAFQTLLFNLHTQSCECLKSELSLFDIPPTQTTIEGSNWVQYKPISSLSDDSPIEFVIPGNGEDYLDLSHTLLNVRVTLHSSVLPKDYPKDVTPEMVNKVAPVNNFLHSMFSQVDVFFNPETRITVEQRVRVQSLYRNIT